MDIMELDLSEIAAYLKSLTFKKSIMGVREDEVFASMRTLNEMYDAKFRALQEQCGAEVARAEEQGQQFSRMILNFQSWKDQEIAKVQRQADLVTAKAEAEATALLQRTQREAAERLEQTRQQCREEQERSRAELTELELCRDRMLTRLAALRQGLQEMERDVSTLHAQLNRPEGRVISMTSHGGTDPIPAHASRF